ncbi:ABC transporter substrate-binding protein [Streptomyces sp. MRC013]|uniref:ABC transporter substrate-binding protein n=1 Tax=Streptomyces sp. MRC013 TaxID=2898276 RepID=UPI002025E513|nr:ABC transporter substrate-binding protein [Streptomyces sp. MRC013]URM88761.1 ABC transporter substrate-binding protein [Streptomyces sp. MRC013]
MKAKRLRTTAGCLALLLISGCRPLADEGGESAPIVIGTVNALTHLDPAGAYDNGSWALYNNVYQSLLTFEPGSPLPQPDAAEGCEFTDPGLTTYRCLLREGLRFSNGSRVTAAAVKHSFDRILRIDDPLGPSPLFSNLKSVEARGTAVIFHLKTADATWPSKIATGAGSIVDPAVYPLDELRTAKEVTGSGPYLISSRTDDRIDLKPNPDYKGAVPHGKGLPIRIRYYQQAQEVEKAWQNGTVDVAYRGLPAATLAKLDENTPGMRLSIGQSAETHYLAINLRRKTNPLAHVAARRAVATLVDRGHLAGKVYGHTVTPLYSLIPQGITGHSTAFFDAYPEVDPEHAKQLLESAGIATPARFALGHQSGTAALEAKELERQLEAGGAFEVTLVEEDDWPTYQRRYARGDFDAFITGWAPDFPDPETFTQPLLGPDSILGNGFSSPEVDTAIRMTQKQTDRGLTREQFRRIQRTIAKSVPLVPLWQQKDYVVTRPHVGGGQYLADGTGVWRLWELSLL